MDFGIIDKIFKTDNEKIQEYQELDLSEYDRSFDENAGKYVRIVELKGFGPIEKLKQEIYNGNILIIKISPIKKNQVAFDRLVKDLKNVVKDVNGDIAMISNEMFVVTPNGIKIDRKKIEII